MVASGDADAFVVPDTPQDLARQDPVVVERRGLLDMRDQHHVGGELLEKLLRKQEDFEFVGGWRSSEEALEALPKLKPDLVLVDLELPAMSGANLIRRVAPLLADTAFVVLTIHGTGEHVFNALRAGASGYLLKSSQPADILSGLRSVRAGGAPLSPEVATMLIGEFRTPPEQRTKEPLPDLSKRERQLLELISAGRTPKESASDLNLSYETVRGYLKRIYQKLHVRSQTEAVVKYLAGRQTLDES